MTDQNEQYTSLCQFPLEEQGNIVLRINENIYIYSSDMLTLFDTLTLAEIGNSHCSLVPYKSNGKKKIIISYINGSQQMILYMYSIMMGLIS